MMNGRRIKEIDSLLDVQNDLLFTAGFCIKKVPFTSEELDFSHSKILAIKISLIVSCLMIFSRSLYVSSRDINIL